MDDQIIQKILEFAPAIPWPVATVLVFYFTREFWKAFADRIRATTDNDKIAELEQFRAVQEGNHNTDLVRLLKSDADQWKVIDGIRRDLSTTQQDVAFIRGQLTKRE